MSLRRRLSAASSLVALSAATVFGQSPATIPVRALTAPTAVSREAFGLILNVRALPGGRVLVNDPKLHRLVVLDSALRVTRVVFDSAPGASNSYGTRPEPIIPYLGDSSLFVDAPSQTFVLIAPDGTVGRVLSAPGDRQIWTVVSSASGTDALGRILYRGLEMRRERWPGQSGLSIDMPGFGMAPISNADSLPLIRGDFATRRVDTIAGLQNLSARRIDFSQQATTRVVTTYVNPLGGGDEWAVLSDGTVAIVRGHDYHVDWITTDDKRTSTGKMPFDWKRLTDDEKRVIRDSALVAAAKSDSARAELMRRAMGGATGSAAAAAVGRAGGAGDGGAVPTMTPRTTVVPIEEMGDFVPPIRPGAARGDLDNNLWILPSTSAQSIAGELVYDVVNRQGELFQRVRLPVGRYIVGFGKGGVVYLQSGDMTKGFQLERARIVDGPSR